MKVLVTGGLGYIGSHTCVELIEQGHDPIVIDNLYNAELEVKDKIKEITGKELKYYNIDACDIKACREVFEKEKPECVIHFAGYKAVGESVSIPLKYYRNNIDSALTILECMQEFGINKFIFSSSATVYAEGNECPLVEGMSEGTTNPYGETKRMIERIVTDYCKVNENFCGVLLRYFNPIGAHKSGLLGESPVGIPNNLMPYICQVAAGRLEKLHVFGNDYDTVDGTGVRDYIHVIDLAAGHVAAIEETEGRSGALLYNLGTGKGTSVLELVKAFEKANDIEIPFVIEGRRPGDIDATYADVSKAEKELKWKAVKTIEEACHSSWEFQKKHDKN